MRMTRVLLAGQSGQLCHKHKFLMGAEVDYPAALRRSQRVPGQTAVEPQQAPLTQPRVPRVGKLQLLLDKVRQGQPWPYKGRRHRHLKQH